jgi:hypothetical protein
MHGFLTTETLYSIELSIELYSTEPTIEYSTELYSVEYSIEYSTVENRTERSQNRLLR